MNVGAHTTTAPFGELHPQFDLLRKTGPTDPLRIAVINNMSDAALWTTERQLCSLLQPASAGLMVELRFYVLPGAKRSDAARAHIAACYDSLESLKQSAPDGMIVTGTEPKQQHFEDEWFWPGMSHLIEWVDEQKVPVIWSCLAAHAAVYYRDAIKRSPLQPKLSGLYECTIDTTKHQLLHRLPYKWRIPHSRRNGLSRKQLDQHGYEILSWSREVGVDMFVKHDQSLQLFWQGHPEYDAGTLISEYHRDVMRVQKSGKTATVQPPVGIWSKSDRISLSGLFRGPRSGYAGGTAPLEADLRSANAHSANGWSTPARRLISNWLLYLDAARQPRQVWARP